ncbi:hypothetical protein [Kitasatospora sp. NPDC098663]|uniref:hypothetical protein n=1 Tax=Kitasatospora sp. NPDC098663 TaxID=3364096 RepID=UPI00380D55E2
MKTPDNDSPLKPRETGFWLTDRALRDQLREAVAGLVQMVQFAVQDDVNIVDALASLAAAECEQAGLDASYTHLVQAQAAHVIANWTIDEASTGPLDLNLLFGLDEFHQLPAKIQAGLLDQYTEDLSQWEDFAPGPGPDLYLSRYEELNGG